MANSNNSREGYGLFAYKGILFNHESPRRGETFVTRKIAKAIARIHHGCQQQPFLGNLDVRRDWGYAADWVEAMWLKMQQNKPDDFVIATGETDFLREVLDEAFGRLDMDWKKYVEIDPRYYRPADFDLLLGDASKAQEQLNWKPKVHFKELVHIVVDSDVKNVVLVR